MPSMLIARFLHNPDYLTQLINCSLLPQTKCIHRWDTEASEECCLCSYQGLLKLITWDKVKPSCTSRNRIGTQTAAAKKKVHFQTGWFYFLQKKAEPSSFASSNGFSLHLSASQNILLGRNKGNSRNASSISETTAGFALTFFSTKSLNYKNRPDHCNLSTLTTSSIQLAVSKNKPPHGPAGTPEGEKMSSGACQTQSEGLHLVLLSRAAMLKCSANSRVMQAEASTLPQWAN